MTPQKSMMAIVVTAALTLPTLAHAACTQQDAMAKATQLSQLVQAKMAKDPASGQAVMMKMQPIMQSSQSMMTAGGTVDWDKVCGQNDALIKQAQ